MLLSGGQPRVQRQHLDAGDGGAHRFCGVGDLALTGEEYQHIARRFGSQLRNGVDDRLGLVARLNPHHLVVGVVRVIGVLCESCQFQRAITDLDRIGAAGHLHDRCAREVVCEPLRIDGGGGDDHLEVRPLGQQLAEVAEQEVDVEAALVCLVEDQSVVAEQTAVTLDLGQQDAVGHQLDQGAPASLIGESHGVPDRPDAGLPGLCQRGAQFLGDTLSNGTGSQPTGLGVPDRAAHAATQLQADLG